MKYTINLFKVSICHLFLVLISFCSILALPKSFEEIQKSKMVNPIRPTFGNVDVKTPSYDVINSCCGPAKKQKKTYLSPKSPSLDRVRGVNIFT